MFPSPPWWPGYLVAGLIQLVLLSGHSDYGPVRACECLQQGWGIRLTRLPTCSVGRVLVRKLLLRGYAVTAMVRNLEDTNLPQSVKLVQGDVKDYQSCRQALDGIDKVCGCMHVAGFPSEAR